MLKKLRDGLPLNEPDINYLKKRKLTETIEIAFKPQLQILENKIRSGKGLSSEDQAWCEKFQFNDLLFMALKAKYKVLMIIPISLHKVRFIVFCKNWNRAKDSVMSISFGSREKTYLSQ